MCFRAAFSEGLWQKKIIFDYDSTTKFYDFNSESNSEFNSDSRHQDVWKNNSDSTLKRATSAPVSPLQNLGILFWCKSESSKIITTRTRAHLNNATPTPL